jgi:multidrug efflux pump subunit AcrB
MIRFFAGHPTAANLMMAAFLILGLIAAPSLLRETFPRIQPRDVQVTVAYPGASPEDVERAICLRIEDAVDGVENVTEVRCEARENAGVATIEMRQGEDLSRFFLDIQTEIEAIDDFPDTAEEPVITQLGRTDFVASIAITGPEDPTALKALAEDLKARMLRFGGIPQIEVKGFSDRQIRIEVADAVARELGLSLEDLASVITRQNVDLPAGEIVSEEGTTLLRFADERLAIDAYRDVVVASSASGGQIRLGDIARIVDRFEDDEVRTLFNGRPAALLDVSKTTMDDTLRVMEAIESFLEQARPTLPPGVILTVTRDSSDILEDRLQMLIVNGLQGLALVFLVMWLFFGLRQAFWIGMGLPVSFLGALAAMTLLGISINMLSMVGLLIVIGILMDDAIVIAENIATKREQGWSPLDAAVEGARQVLPSILSSFLTTVAIFGSLAFLKGDIGEVLRVVPVVMTLVLAVSLVEAFLILPNHLAHGAAADRPSALNRRVEEGIVYLRKHVVTPLATLAVAHRYLTLGIGGLLFLVSVATIAGGVLKFQAFPEIDGDQIEARIELAASATLDDTEAVVEEVLAALDQVDEALSPGNDEGAPLIQDVLVRFSENADAGTTGAYLASVNVDLLQGEARAATNAEILNAWRDEMPVIPEIQRLNLTEPSLGPAGRAIETRLRHPDVDTLALAAADLQAWFGRYLGAYNLADDLQAGKPELRLSLRDGAGALGLDAQAIAQQLRAAFYGVTADEIQIGVESYEVDLRLTEANRNSLGDLDAFSVQTPGGERVPLTAVARIEEDRGYTRINRIDRLPAVTVTGDVDTAVANANEIVSDAEARFFPVLIERYPGLLVGTEGQNAEAATTQRSMLSGLLIGLIGVFLLLSFQFRSYTEPLVVMTIIPFALVGAVFGHLALGHDFSLPSTLGLISLAGIVVNDSILLVNFIKDEHEPGAVTVAEAAPKGAAARFRAILLTSVTTIAGVTPLLFETSLQAQVLIPLVTSIAFGLMATTLLMILIVPAFYAILDDFGMTSLAAERRRRAQAEATAMH